MKRNDQRKPRDSKATTAVETIAQALRTRALRLEEGDYLGSEDELSREFRVSAPTLRQAARLLEHEDVIKVKRGLYGGYYARRPKIETIARVAATYLRGNASSIDEIETLLDALTPLLVSLVLRSKRRHALEEFAVPGSKLPPLEIFFDNESRFSNLLVELTGNSALRLVLSIFFQVNLSVPRKYRASDKALLLRIQQTRIAVAQALLAKDEEAAVARILELRRLIYRGVRRSLDEEKRSAKRAFAQDRARRAARIAIKRGFS